MFNFKTMLKDCKTLDELINKCKAINLTDKDCFNNLFDKKMTEKQKQNVIKFSIICQLCSKESILEAFGFDEGLNETDKLKKIINKLSSKKDSLAFKKKKELSFKSKGIADFIKDNNLNNGDLNKFSFDNEDDNKQQKQNIANNLSIILFGTGGEKGIGKISENFVKQNNYQSFANLIETSLVDITNDKEKKLYDVVNFYYKDQNNKFKKDNRKENIVKFLISDKDNFSDNDLKNICAIDKNSKSSLSSLIKRIDLSNDNNVDINALKAALRKYNILSLKQGIGDQTKNLVFGFLCSNYNNLNDDNKKEINDYIKKQFLSINNIDNNNSLIDDQDIESIVDKISENYLNSENIEDFTARINDLKQANISFGKVDDEASITPENKDTINYIIEDMLIKYGIDYDPENDKLKIETSTKINDILSLVESKILDGTVNDDIKEEILQKLKFKLKVVATKSKELYNQETSYDAIDNF